jgi:hypothetical protein
MCSQGSVCPVSRSLRNGVGFRYNEETAYVFASGDGTEEPKFMFIRKDVRDSLSPLVEQSTNLYNTFYELSKQFAE